MMDSYKRTYEKARAKCGLDSKVDKAQGWAFPDEYEDECRAALLSGMTHPAVDEWRKARNCYERAVHVLE